MGSSRIRPGIMKPDAQGVPSGWRVEQLGFVSSTTGGGRLGLTKESDYRTAGFPAFSAAGQDGFVDRWEFESPAVIVPSIGSIGRAYRAEGRWTTLANTQIIFPREGLLDYRFLQHRVDGTDFWPVSGTAQPFIKPSDIPKCWLALPPLAEQRRVAEILDTLNVAIRNTEQLIAKLNQVRLGLVQDLLTNGIDEGGELRDPARHPEQFTESALGRLPKHWKSTTVRALLDNGVLIDVQDGNHGELHPKRSDFVTEGVPFLMARDMAGGVIDFEHCYRIRESQSRRLRIGHSRAGDVLLSHKGTIGETARVPPQASAVVLTPQVTFYRVAAPNPNLTPQYLLTWMSGPLFQGKLKMLAAQSTRDYVGITAQRSLPIVLPPLAEQEHIVRAVTQLGTRIDAESAEAVKLRLLKHGLLEDLLTGRVRPTRLLNEAAA